MRVNLYRGALAFILGVAWLGGVGASECRAILARSLGQPISAYSASLFGKKNLTAQERQVLACDPDEPMAGSTSVQYNPNLVRVTGFEFGPGYERFNGAPSLFPSGAAVEVALPGGLQLRDLAQYLSSPFGAETGYLQLFYQEDGKPKGTFPAPPGNTFLQSNGPESVDTHRFFFEYLSVLARPHPPASYMVYADSGSRPSGNTPDFLLGPDGTPSNFNEIQPAQVAGMLGDFNGDGLTNATDIDLLCDRINAPTGPISPFDVDGDGQVTHGILNFEVTDILDTRLGDTDTDGDVDLSDLGNLAAGFQVAGEKRWSRGNFDCDNDVDLPDLGRLATNFGVGSRLAFEQFEALVPEPSMLTLAGVGTLRASNKNQDAFVSNRSSIRPIP